MFEMLTTYFDSLILEKGYGLGIMMGMGGVCLSYNY